MCFLSDFLLIAMDSVSWSRPKASCPRTSIVAQILSRNFISTLTPAHIHTSLAISFVSILKNLSLRSSQEFLVFMDCYGLTTKHRLMFWNTCSADGAVFGGCDIFRGYYTVDRSRSLGLSFECYTWPLTSLVLVLLLVPQWYEQLPPCIPATMIRDISHTYPHHNDSNPLIQESQ